MKLAVHDACPCLWYFLRQTNKFIDLVLHLPLQCLHFLQHYPALDHRVHEIARPITSSASLGATERFRGLFALAERVPNRLTGREEDKGMEVREQDVVLQGEQRDALAGVQI